MSDIVERLESKIEQLKQIALNSRDARHIKLLEGAVVEIERLQSAKRQALQLADERAKENVWLRSQITGSADGKQAGETFDGATSALISEAYSMLGLTLTLNQARRLARAALSAQSAVPSGLTDQEKKDRAAALAQARAACSSEDGK
jgi:Mg2+ and Co2+ transporter CorA